MLFLSGQGALGSGLDNSTRIFTPVEEMHSEDWDHPAELHRVWQAALVRIPVHGGQYIETTVSELPSQHLATGELFPTIIFLHGCSGIGKGVYTRINFLAAHGYAVIAPPSLARQKYPQSCDPENYRGGLYRDTLRMRQYDAGHAIETAKTLAWVDPDRIFLMGLSEGAIVAATYRSQSGKASVKARIVESWTCHAGWDEYRGVNAPADEPVLTLVAANDPWFQSPTTKGECTGFLDPHNGSKSVVYTDETLSHKHALLEKEIVQAEVLEFLEKHH